MKVTMKWARERNFAKFRIKGIINNLHLLIDQKVTLRVEKGELKRAIIYLNETLENWESRNTLSKNRYVKEVI